MSVPLYRRRWFQLTLGLAVCVFFLWLSMRKMLGTPDAGEQILSAFRQADYRTAPLFLLLLFSFYWLKAWRWRLMLLSVGDYRPMRDLFGPIMIGFALNNTLPARVGEFVRCYVFHKRQSVPLATTLASIVLERVFDGIAVVVYFALGLAFVRGLDPSVQQNAIFVAVAAAMLAAAGLAYVVWTKPFIAILERVLRLVPFIPGGLTDRVCRMLETGAQGLSSLKNVRLLLAILVISLVKWGLNAALFYISLRSFRINVEYPLATSLVLMGTVAFAVAVPSVPGFFGIIQGCFTEVLGLFNVPPAAAFAASIYYHLMQWIPVTLIGWGYLLGSGFSVRQIEKVEDDLEAQP